MDHEWIRDPVEQSAALRMSLCHVTDISSIVNDTPHQVGIK